ncbi:MAG: hypothetical protein HQM14_21805 [SAR324 cluster bacterium]|nr:hypothetical protein [SAR324 cluster bacterium]
MSKKIKISKIKTKGLKSSKARSLLRRVGKNGMAATGSRFAGRAGAAGIGAGLGGACMGAGAGGAGVGAGLGAGLGSILLGPVGLLAAAGLAGCYLMNKNSTTEKDAE